jgi:hypothetical protein
VPVSTLVVSNAVTVTGIDHPATLQVSGGEYSIGCMATFTNLAGMIGNNQSICVRHTSSTSYLGTRTTTLTVGGVSAQFVSTTGVPVVIGFNLAGNGFNAPLDVAALFGNQGNAVPGVTDKVEAVWAWNAATQKWRFHTPQFTAAASAAYADANDYEVLTILPPGAGYWVSATQPLNVPAQAGTAFDYDPSGFDALPPSFNLLSTGSTLTVQQFNASVGVAPVNFNALWAWDASRSKWYFYSPVLERPGAPFTNAEYGAANGYQDFAGGTPPAPAFSLQPGAGFWVEK